MTNNPYSVQIEPVFGCNRRCEFCALTYILHKEGVIT